METELTSAGPFDSSELALNQYSLFTSNLSGKVRQESLDGKEYIVAPLTMILSVVIMFTAVSTCAARVAPEVRFPDRIAAHFNQGVTLGSNVMVVKLKTGVYEIRNLVNDKVYVGSAAKSFTKRWSEHRLALRKGIHGNRHLQASWIKYGEQGFKFSVLERCEPEKCLEVEQKWMNEFSSGDHKFGYNISPTAGSSLGIKRSESTRAKISLAMQGRKPSQEMIEAARKANTGRPCPKSPEHRAKISASHKGKKLSKDHVEKLRKANTGRIPTEETRRKLSFAARNRSAETRRKLSQAVLSRDDVTKVKVAEATAKSNRERVWTEESRNKIRNSLLGRKRTEASKRKQSEALRGRTFSVEHVSKLSDAKRLYWQNRRREGGSYNWEVILDGQIHLLLKGEDFSCQVNTVKQLAKTAAAQMNRKVRSQTTNEGNVVIQAFDIKERGLI